MDMFTLSESNGVWKSEYVTNIITKNSISWPLIFSSLIQDWDLAKKS